MVNVGLVAAQILVNGLVTGSIYALIASGLSLIYSTGKFYHFAHVGVITLSAYFLYFFFNVSGMDFFGSMVLAVAITTLVGWLVNNVVYRHLRRRKVNNVTIMVSGFSILVILQAAILIAFGASVKVIGNFPWQNGVSIFGVIISPLNVYTIAIALFLLSFLFWFMKYTKRGKAMRAVASNEKMAEVLGISSEKTLGWSIIIATSIGAVGGILIGLSQNLQSDLGINLTFMAFAAMIVGGMTSVAGSVVGALLVGIIQNVAIWFVSPSYSYAVTFAVIVVFLILKPEGLFGIKRGGA